MYTLRMRFCQEVFSDKLAHVKTSSVTLYLMRHAEREPGRFYNPARGREDPPLSRYGRLQARRIAKVFGRKPITAIYVSQFLRALQTAGPLARKLRLVPIRDGRLNEIDNGELEGLSDEEVQARFPETWAAYKQRSRDFRFPGGETGAEAQSRIAAFVEEQREHPGEKLVVAHDGILRVLLCYLLGIPVYRRFDFRIGFTGWSEITRGPHDAQWTLVRFNQEER